MRDMLTKKIGRSGISASTVGLGTWAIGGWMWGGTDEKAAIAAIQAAIDEGVSLIDTAPAYGMGCSEEIVGRAIKGRRDKVVLSTKCGLVWHVQRGNYFFSQQDMPVHRYLGRESIRHEVEESLRRLGTDYIDHFITHWQDPTTPVAETMAVLEELKAEGKIRSVGASNCSVEDAQAYIASGSLDVLQEEYSMVKRDLEREILPLCRENSVSVMSYSSLALGLLSGKIGPERTFMGDDLRKENSRFSAGNRQKIASLMELVRPIAEDHNASEAQIVIAWTLAQPGITFSLCGARNPEQARENAGAGRIRLSPDDLFALDAAVAKHLSQLDG
jgi:methylglyoxal reductase